MSVAASDLRWCSDGFEIECDLSRTVTATLAKDCCDMLIEVVERRFGTVNAVPPERELEFLTDNGSAYIAHETRSIARSLGLTDQYARVQPAEQRHGRELR